MYRGKRAKGWNIKSGVLFASLVLLIALTVGTTVAFLMDDTNTVENTFQPAQVSCAIQETFDGSTKQNVYAQNTSNIDAYIRAEILVNWVKKDGNAYKIVPKPTGYGNTEFQLGQNWVKDGEYYYYTEKLAPGEKTTDLIDRIAPTKDGTEYSPTENDTYFLQVEIIAEAIQADGLDAASAQKAWAKAREVQP